MGLSKPYYRIARPKAYIPDYVIDSRYAPDRLQLSRAYINIEKELSNIFNHVGECQVFCVSFKKKFYGEGNLPICISSRFSELLCKS